MRKIVPFQIIMAKFLGQMVKKKKLLRNASKRRLIQVTICMLLKQVTRILHKCSSVLQATIPIMENMVNLITATQWVILGQLKYTE